jgi:hypothetical protein
VLLCGILSRSYVQAEIIKEILVTFGSVEYVPAANKGVKVARDGISMVK